jgi:hypothetical protein
MRRRTKPARAKDEAKSPGARRSRKDEGSRIHDLEKRLAESLKREAEALGQQTATAEILRVISQSPTDVQPVFDTLVASAIRLLPGHSAALTRIAGDQIELAAFTSTDAAGDAARRAAFPQSLQSETTNAQTIRDRAPFKSRYRFPRDSRHAGAVREVFSPDRGYRSHPILFWTPLALALRAGRQART